MFEDLRRVQTDKGSYIEPRFNPHWGEFKQLQWKAALAAHDTGLSIRVYREESGVRLGGRWFNTKSGRYGYAASFQGGVGLSFDKMWSFLSGFSAGAYCQRVTEKRRLAGESA